MILLRAAIKEDARLFYDARYSRIANKFSLNKQIPSYEDHEKWFLKNYKEGFYTIMLDSNRIGYIRIQNNKVSIAVLPEYQNKGFGTKAMEQLMKQYGDAWGYLEADIRMENIASVKLFNKFKTIKMLLR